MRFENRELEVVKVSPPDVRMQRHARRVQPHMLSKRGRFEHLPNNPNAIQLAAFCAGWTVPGSAMKIENGQLLQNMPCYRNSAQTNSKRPSAVVTKFQSGLEY